MKKFLLLSFTALATAGTIHAQYEFDNLDLEQREQYLRAPRAVTTAVPIISVTPDSRAAGMGDAGVASSPDANSLYWNPAKLAFLPEGTTVLSLSYTPWLNKLVNDINLAYLSYAIKLSENQAAGIAMRYFSLGQINFKDNDNNSLGTFSPYEFTLNGAYSLKLSEEMSLAVGLRYIFSDLTQGQAVGGIETKPGQMLSADVGYYYQSREYNMDGGRRQSFSAGVNISNIGGKISYGNDAASDFIPTNLRLGGGYHLQFDQYNRMSFLLDFNKLLVPTPPIRDDNGNIVAGEDDDVTGFAGVFQSFGDAPAGLEEEMEEVVINTGVEFWYDNKFAVRGGYQFEDQEKGGRQYFTMGLGLKYNVFGLDFAYLIPASATVRSPLENTLRFTLFFDFENFADQ